MQYNRTLFSYLLSLLAIGTEISLKRVLYSWYYAVKKVPSSPFRTSDIQKSIHNIQLGFLN